MNKTAQKVADILKRDVKRPGLPKMGALSLYWNRKGDNCCAMGLHPKATSPRPTMAGEFPATNSQVVAFGDWFDMQVDPRATVEAIWGK